MNLDDVFNAWLTFKKAANFNRVHEKLKLNIHVKV